MPPNLKVTPQIVYTMLSIAQGPTHGYAILSDVEQRSGGEVRLGPSSLYYSLGRLEDLELIEEVAAPAEASDADPHVEQRRYFALTGSGREVLRRELSLMRGLVEQARALGFDTGV